MQSSLNCGLSICGLEKFRMRARFAIAVLVVGIAGLSEANAADFVSGYSAGGVRAPQLLVYDNEPGVYVRAYWSAPWQNRHYYPFTGKKPKVGRHERLNAVRAAPEPAESYNREWSTLSLFPPPPPQAVAPQPPEQHSGPLK
jgi:hypothetical protein